MAASRVPKCHDLHPELHQRVQGKTWLAFLCESLARSLFRDQWHVCLYLQMTECIQIKSTHIYIYIHIYIHIYLSIFKSIYTYMLSSMSFLLTAHCLYIHTHTCTVCRSVLNIPRWPCLCGSSWTFDGRSPNMPYLNPSISLYSWPA